MEQYGGAIAGAVLGILTSAVCAPAATASAFAATTRRLLAGFGGDDVDSDAATSVLPHSRVRSLPHGDFLEYAPSDLLCSPIQHSRSLQALDP